MGIIGDLVNSEHAQKGAARFDKISGTGQGTERLAQAQGPDGAILQQRATDLANNYGGDLINRQILSPEYLQQLLQLSQGQQMSAAEIQMRAALEQQQAQAYGMAVSGANAMNPALAMRQAQQANMQAGLQAQSQFGAMRADEIAKAQALYAQVMLGQQQTNDAAAQNMEAMINQLIQTQYGGDVAKALADQEFLNRVAGGVLTGAGTAVAAYALPTKV